jgi:hypothetical protein
MDPYGSSGTGVLPKSDKSGLERGILVPSNTGQLEVARNELVVVASISMVEVHELGQKKKKKKKAQGTLKLEFL